jgi:hypothetical protein
MTNLNDNQTYKAILESLLKALARHPEFSEIKEMVDSHMPANAAGRVKEILAKQEVMRESIAAQELDPATGLWLYEAGTFNNNAPFIIPSSKPVAETGEDDLFILIPDATDQQVNEAAKNNNPWFDIPESGDNDDDDFYVETYGA